MGFAATAFYFLDAGVGSAKADDNGIEMIKPNHEVRGVQGFILRGGDEWTTMYAPIFFDSTRSDWLTVLLLGVASRCTVRSLRKSHMNQPQFAVMQTRFPATRWHRAGLLRYARIRRHPEWRHRHRQWGYSSRSLYDQTAFQVALLATLFPVGVSSVPVWPGRQKDPNLSLIHI